MSGNSFINEYLASTEPHPLHASMRIWKDSVVLALYKKWTSDTIHLSAVMSFAQKNNGEGSACLKWLCGLADKHRVRLDLVVRPIKNVGSQEGTNLSKAQLVAWYQRYGFVKQAADHMVREPQVGSSIKGKAMAIKIEAAARLNSARTRLATSNDVRKIRRAVGPGRTQIERGNYYINFENTEEAFTRAKANLEKIYGAPTRAGDSWVYVSGDGLKVSLKGYKSGTNNYALTSQ